MDRLEESAKAGYESYAVNCDWKNYQGNPMPQWDELPENIKSNWKAAVKGIFSHHWQSLSKPIN